MATQNAKDTKTGGKTYDINLGRAGINEGDRVPTEEYRAGTSGSPDDQGGVSPFGGG
jgi:hypothetical protein